ncbi:uncharacterized protein Z518_07778 [Rhinocladiella mackenziei CBS 650.93]|uniref:Uncharacterized protein n=1 Tax=Rhinocladiella mackenziei CBS 650.93 TaxID=1442369 RepID=A0A0D2IEG9_9EURO|nr:uncharacterized protein Z518_07778 [Rhinocladiella mackenziei CBS 650.93]KIX04224.1 hypothetical protein Z518_07778 [Rhinocladiella mackenziei CBS 650.93]
MRKDFTFTLRALPFTPAVALSFVFVAMSIQVSVYQNRPILTLHSTQCHTSLKSKIARFDSRSPTLLCNIIREVKKLFISHPSKLELLRSTSAVSTEPSAHLFNTHMPSHRTSFPPFVVLEIYPLLKPDKSSSGERQNDGATTEIARPEPMVEIAVALNDSKFCRPSRGVIS